MKTHSLDQVQDELIGKIGTPERDRFEYELQMDLLVKAIKQTPAGTPFTNKFSNMKVLNTELPDEVELYEAKMVLSAYMFDREILSSGQAAEFACVSRKTFLEDVGKYGVSIFGETGEDLEARHA